MKLIRFLAGINLKIITVLLLLTDLNLEAEQLYVYVKPQYSKIWKDLIQNYKLPGGTEVIKLTSPEYNTYGNFLYISKSSWADAEKGEKRTEFIKKNIRTFIYAPAVPFMDKNSNISLADLQHTQNVKIVPVTNIELPLKALSVNHIYLDNKNYPLKIKYFINLHSINSGFLDWINSIAPESADNNGVVWIEAVGDTMLARGVDLSLLEADGTSYIFGNTLSILENSDFLLGNLECVASLKGTEADKRYHFHFNPKVLKNLKEIGFSYFSIANNHSLDYGLTGFLDALANLKSADLGFSGAGKNLENASKPFLANIKGEKIQVFSAGAYPVESSGFDGRKFTAKNHTPGILWADKYLMNLLSLKASKNTFDIVMIHGGREWTSVPTEKQKKLYRAIIDHGADIVIGSHPHFLQGFEIYRHKLIAYSLGNFIFPGMEETEYGEDSIILKVGVYGGRILYLEIYPVSIRGRRIELSKGSRIKNRLIKLTEALR